MSLLGPVTLRDFVADDLPLLRAWLQTAGLGVPDRIDPRALGARLLGDTRILMRTAEVDRATVGFVRLDLAPDRSAELTILVDPRRRRRGLGRQMLLAALEAARTRGLNRLIAVVADANDVARNFFFEQGFERSEAAVPGFDHLVRYVHRSDRQEPLEIVP